MEYLLLDTTLTSDDHPDKPTRLSNLSTGYQHRFKRLADLEKAVTSTQQASASLETTTQINHLASRTSALFQDITNPILVRGVSWDA